MNDEAPKTMKVLTFTFRQRGVLSEGFEIRTPVTVPVVKIWYFCQRIIEFDSAAWGDGARGRYDGRTERLTIAQCNFCKLASQKNT